MDETRTPAYRAVAKTLREMIDTRRQELNLNWYSTLFRLPPEIASLVWLKKLAITGSPLRDLSPIAPLTALEELILDRTQVSDLAAIAGMTKMQDAAVSSLAHKGLSYAGTPVSRKPPFDQLVQLDQPARTVETINEVRRQRGLPAHTPSNYERPVELPPPPPSDSGFGEDKLDFGDDEEDDREQLAQKPASHSFSLRDSRIEAQAQSIPPRYPDIAADIRNEVSEKAKEAASRLTKSNAPQRVVSTVARLNLSLGNTLEDVRAGILQMRFRSLEADVAVYDTEEGRKELSEDTLAMLRDLTSSVEDLMGCFPQLADIEAERLAQRLKEADVPRVMEALSQIRQVAEDSEAVAPSATEALRAGEPELEHDTEIIDSAASEAARIAATSARDRTVGYMLLVYRNFVAGVLKAGGELAGFGTETWREFRKDAPKQLSDAGIALTIAALVGALLGPAAALGAFSLTFRPLRERAKRVVEKLTSLTKKAHGVEIE